MGVIVVFFFDPAILLGHELVKIMPCSVGSHTYISPPLCLTHHPNHPKSSIMAASDETQPLLPLSPIPGSYGIPYVTAISDRLDYFYLQGELPFFTSRMKKYNSTVLRLNMPPGPFISSDSRVIAVLDAVSFPVLFDSDKIDKTDTLTGTYVPSTSLTGGFRVCAYLDPSEPAHSKLKTLALHLVASRKSAFIPAFITGYSGLFVGLEANLEAKQPANFNKLNESTAFEFFCQAFFGSSPADTPLGTTGPSRAAKWLFLQLHPLITLGLPMLIEDPLLHSYPLPAIIARSDYNALYNYFSSAATGTKILEMAEKLEIEKNEAIHNLLFNVVFNAYGGVKLLMPTIMKRVSQAGAELHARLAKEVRAAVEVEGGKVTAAAVEKMELVKSVVWEVLRIDPPVKYQYGRAKKDFLLNSHAASYQVKKGEMLFGYQPLATRDEKVFKKGDEFVADRFVGEEGRKLLRYVVWSNGPETESTTAGNKQCAGKDLVVLMGRLLLVVLFLNYDTFAADVKVSALGDDVVFTSLKKAV